MQPQGDRPSGPRAGLTRAVDRALEILVLPSFTRIGLMARRRLANWRPLEDYDRSGCVALVTGATSGIGMATAVALARIGVHVVLLGRDEGRTARALEEVRTLVPGASLSSVVASMDEPEDVRRAVSFVLSAFPRLDILVHNAGALAERYRQTSVGVEETSAAQVAGPFLMTGLLLDRLIVSRGRVITVSSGGAYLAPLSVDGLSPRPSEFDGSRQYARAKRAQITLNELWAERTAGLGVTFNAMHPGWVDTPGLAASLPQFRSLLKPLLRTPTEGADTVVWLAADDAGATNSGRFWLDRVPRPAHRLRRTRRSDTPVLRAQLWAWCEEHSGWRWGIS